MPMLIILRDLQSRVFVGKVHYFSSQISHSNCPFSAFRHALCSSLEIMAQSFTEVQMTDSIVLWLTTVQSPAFDIGNLPTFYAYRTRKIPK